MHIVLHEPEIPQNTGNIARTCRCTDSALHLIEPMGFELKDKKFRRAGCDYWHDVDIRIHNNFSTFCDVNPGARLWLFTAHCEKYYHQVEYRDGDYLVFGKESVGLPLSIRDQYLNLCLRVPMVKGNRSLNLSNAVAIVLYEALRQTEFERLI